VHHSNHNNKDFLLVLHLLLKEDLEHQQLLFKVDLEHSGQQQQ
jgi:hypothetical protein